MLLPAGRLLLQWSCGGGRRCYQFGDAAAVTLGWRVPAIWWWQNINKMGNTFKLGNYVNGIFQDASNNIGIGGSPSGSYKLEVTGTAKVSSTLLVSGAATFATDVTIGSPTTNATLSISGDNSGGDSFLNFKADVGAIKGQIQGTKNGANGGIIYFDSLNQYNEYTIINSDLPDNSVVAIEIDGNGQPWFLSPAAGLVYDTGVGGPWNNFNNLNSGLPSNALNCLQFMGDELVIGSEVSGLIFKDGESWQYLNTLNSELPDDYVLSIKIDELQNIWVGTFNAGLCKINLQNSIEEYLNKGVLCYPNPIETNGKVHFTKSFSGVIRIYNNIGELLCLNHVLNCKSLALPENIIRGSYVITFSNDLSQSTQSIIVK